MDTNFSCDMASHDAHHVRVHSIGYKTLRVENDSRSSESSYNPNRSDVEEVIAVYIVNPYQPLLDSSSDDDGEEYITHKNSSITDENSTSYPCQEGEDICFETPIVSNIDEYFVKKDNKDQHILNDDEPVVQNFDEYFLDLGINAAVPNIDDYFIKHKLPEERAPQFDLPDSSTKIENVFFTKNNKPQANGPESLRLDTDTNIDDISIDESELEALPKIDDLKKYLVDDMTYTKFRQNQKTCSVPPSPMQNICIDVDDTKNYIGFDYLNLDLSNRSNEKVPKQGKSEDVLKTLTEDDIDSFICKYTNTDDAMVKHNEDDLSPQDMEIETTISSGPPLLDTPSSRMTSSPIPTVLNFCIEKTSIATPVIEPKIDLYDFVEANNLISLLEQFEATEKLNTKKCPEPIVNYEDSKLKSSNKNSFTNGMRLQDAALQLNKTDYCSPKKRHNVPNLRKGQSLLKPEVLSSNNKILRSRHRSCKSKKVSYRLSSDEESEDRNSKSKKVCRFNDIDLKKKYSAKPSVKAPVQSNCCKKRSPTHSDSVKSKNKTNNSVMLNNAFKASDKCSQHSNSSIKLTIKNKFEVILNCDYIDSQNEKTTEVVCKNSDNMNNVEKEDKSLKELGKNKLTVVNSPRVEEEPHSKSKKKLSLQDYKLRRGILPKTSSAQASPEATISAQASPRVEEEPHSKSKKKLSLQDYKLRRGILPKTSSAQASPEATISAQASPRVEEEPHSKSKKKLSLQEYKLRRGILPKTSSAQASPEATISAQASPLVEEEPHSKRKKKLSLQEYKLRRGILPKTSSAQASPEATILPNLPELDKPHIPFTAEKENNEENFDDPINYAGRKYLKNLKRKKTAANIKSEEAIIRSKIPKVENFQLQPLISDAEMMKLEGMINSVKK